MKKVLKRFWAIGKKLPPGLTGNYIHFNCLKLFYVLLMTRLMRIKKEKFLIVNPQVSEVVRTPFHQ